MTPEEWSGVKVTGPDGTNPIKDEQIRELVRLSPTSNPIHAWATEALDGNPRSRTRCAAAWNARNGGDS